MSKKTKRILLWLAAGMFFGAIYSGSPASAMKVVHDEDVLNVGGRLQLLGVAEFIDDPWNDSERLFLFLNQSRLKLDGTYSGVDFAVEFMLGGEEVPESNTVMSLLDFYANVPLADNWLAVRFGQFKVPYGRERLFASGAMFNTERSINNNFFNIGRDVGVAAHGQGELLTGALGVFTAAGINVPGRYIPEDLGFPMIVARLGVNNGLDQDILNPFQNDEARGHGTRFAAYLNGMYTKDSRVGHSSPLALKNHDNSMFLNQNWNPYLRDRGQKAEYMQVGADVAVEFPLRDSSALLLSAEANFGKFENDNGKIESSGGVLGVNLLRETWEIGLRYAAVDPGNDYAYTETDADTGTKTLHSITDKIIHEITPSIVYNWHRHNLKIITDLTIQLDVPVAREPGTGVYNLMLQPDQVSYVTRGGIEHQDLYIGRMIVQYTF